MNQPSPYDRWNTHFYYGMVFMLGAGVYFINKLHWLFQSFLMGIFGRGDMVFFSIAENIGVHFLQAALIYGWPIMVAVRLKNAGTKWAIIGLCAATFLWSVGSQIYDQFFPEDFIYFEF